MGVEDLHARSSTPVGVAAEYTRKGILKQVKSNQIKSNRVCTFRGGILSMARIRPYRLECIPTMSCLRFEHTFVVCARIVVILDSSHRAFRPLEFLLFGSPQFGLCKKPAFDLISFLSSLAAALWASNLGLRPRANCNWRRYLTRYP